MRRSLPHFLAAVIVMGAALVLLYPLCNVLFRCGCEALWMAAAERCNVHQATGPHCPWCEHPALGNLAVILILAFQVPVYVYTWRRSLSVLAASGAALAALPAAAVLTAFLTWLPTDYPHLLVKDLRPGRGLPNGPIHCVRP